MILIYHFNNLIFFIMKTQIYKLTGNTTNDTKKIKKCISKKTYINHKNTIKNLLILMDYNRCLVDTSKAF